MNMQTEALTPLMKQYHAVKAAHPDEMVFFRLGDFYEMFGDDAAKGNAVLGLVLTSRHGIPMCGIPFHSASVYIAKLLKAGHKVAICEQVEGDAGGKGLFRREVIRVITPGTLLEDELLDSKVSNFLVCVALDIVGWGLACAEISTGDFWATQKIGDDKLSSLSAALARISPSEIVCDAKTADRLKARGVLPDGAVLTICEPLPGDIVPPDGWTSRDIWANRQLALRAALETVRYVTSNEPNLKGALVPAYREAAVHMQLDESAVKTLELVGSSAGREYSLWGVLDNAVTPMGSRMLRQWILQPLIDPPEVWDRQHRVEDLFEDASSRENLCDILRGISDVERAMSRVAAQSAAPRDLAALRASLQTVPAVKSWLALREESMSSICARIENVYRELKDAHAMLSCSLTDNPPAKVSDGGVIREGFNAELDELRAIKKDSRALLQDLESREREASGISNLKVGYNSVFGYYIEVSRSNISKVPASYIRKQTLANSERYITEELKTLESKILGAEDRILRLESHLFRETVSKLAQSLPALRTYAKCVAELDVYYSLAVAALNGGYVKPEVHAGHELIITSGRHPVAERSMPPGVFVPNNLSVGTKDEQILVITGPNMSGKSVYLRQNALIVIMAQIGSFVPAESARVGVVDRIMTRIGAHDALSRGESTFMVEMRETAGILASVTPRSLILLDEVGRGTSTFDGISIAWAVIEYLHRPDGGGAKVLFATHYFELTEFEEKHRGIKNYNVEVKELTNASGKTELIFLHKIAEGPADKSYGIHVAELAGLPAACILRARKVLEALEKDSALSIEGPDRSAPLLPLFSSNPVLDEIRICNPDKLSPLEALQLVIQWKKRV